MAEQNLQTYNSERKGRQLGPWESLSAYLSGLHSSGIFYHAAVIKTSHPLRDDDVIAACQIIVRKQEALQMRIVPTDGLDRTALRFHFTPMENPEKIDFESIGFKTIHDWPMYICEDHEKRQIDIFKGPLWRIILGRVEEADSTEELPHQYVILLKFVHAIVDGISVFDFLNKQLLTVLSDLINNAGARIIIPPLSLPDSAEHYFPQAQNSISWRSKLGLDFLRWKKRTFKSNESPIYMFPDEKRNISLNEELKWSLLSKESPCVPRIFEAEICIPVMEAARKHGMTVHCVLLTAGAVALSRTASLARVQLPRFFKQQWTINLRKFLNITAPQPLGFLVAESSTVHENLSNFTVDNFWRLCNNIQKQVDKGKNKESCIQYLRGIKYFVDAAGKTSPLTVLSEMPPPSLLLSNLGNTLADPDVNTFEGPVKMRVVEQHFSLTGLGVTNWSPISQFLLTFRQRFMWNTVYNPKKVSRKFIDMYLDNIKDVLITFCRDG